MLSTRITAPLYNAGFKSTWSNDNNHNKGTAIFEWQPNLIANKQYYFFVEIDPDNNLDEFHEGRYGTGNTLNDYGGNNTGFYPFYVYDQDDIRDSKCKLLM